MRDLYEIDIPDRESFERLKPDSEKRLEIERHAAEKFLSNRESFAYEGECSVCKQTVFFSIDWLYAKKPVPNWRERLVCSECGLSNRQRYAMYLLLRECSAKEHKKVYLQEQNTPFFDTARRLLGPKNVVGSKYLGPSIPPGTVIDGIRHEDTERLSFPDDFFPAVVATDVLEHVNDPEVALGEICRVLIPGGLALITVPFDPRRDRSERRAVMNKDGSVNPYAPPEYRGNPHSEGGSLVCRDFGWDLLQSAKKVGFSQAFVRGYWGFRSGHLGDGLQMVFIFRKDKEELTRQLSSEPNLMSSESNRHSRRSLSNRLPFANQKTVFVLGMHRSGTSALSGILGKLGFAMPQNLLLGAAENPKGFFESIPILELNEEILAAGGSRWDDWRAFDTAALSKVQIQQFRRRILDVLFFEFGNAPTIVVKDPRICRFAPLWLESVAHPIVLIPYRHPLEVALSLHKRNEMPIAVGLLLWLRHILDAERFSRDLPRAFISMSELIDDWRSCLTVVAEKTQLTCFSSTTQMSDEIDAFLERGLKHHNISNDEAKNHALLHGWILEAYNAVIGLAHGNDDKQYCTRMDSIHRNFDTASVLFGPAIACLEQKLSTQ